MISLQNANKNSNKFSSAKNRPIIISIYNSSNTVFIVRKKSLLIEQIKFGDYNFFNLTITKLDGMKFSVYIFTDKVNISYIA